MANILDYLDWRGDLTVAQAPFNEVDNLILAELAFVNFGGIVPGPGVGESISLRQAADAFFARIPDGEKVEMGVLVPDEIVELLRRAAESARFCDMKLSCFVDWLDYDRAEQFAAMTVETGDGALYLAFRGTDDTLAGWKEDFHMACMAEVPAQNMALNYLRKVASLYPRRKMRMGGHSKGGNLAVYAAVFAPAIIQKRLLTVWSNDGPGFRETVLSLPQHARIADRIITIVPKSSVVGMILEHDEDYTVVDSSQKGLLQHDGFSWEVLGGRFVKLRSVTRQARINDRVLKEWVRNMPLEQREKFVDGLFEVLTASGAETLTDLKEEKIKTAGAMVKAMKDMEKDTRDALIYAVKVLFRSNAKVLLEELQQETEKKAKKKISSMRKQEPKHRA